MHQLHKSHSAHHFATERYKVCVSTFLLENGALWDICPMHCGICEMDLITENNYDLVFVFVLFCFGWKKTIITAKFGILSIMKKTYGSVTLKEIFFIYGETCL